MSTISEGAAVAGDLDDGAFTIFINYRRGDEAGYAREIFNRAVEAFDRDSVYFDVAEEGGVQWLNELYAAGRRSGVFVSVIGPNWLSLLTARTPDDPDYVRAEIRSALMDWPGIILPVLIDTRVPEPSKLPRSLRGLFRAQAISLRHAEFETDVEILIQRLHTFRAMNPAERADYRRLQLAAMAEVPIPRRERTARAEVPAPTDAHFEDVTDALLAGTAVPLLGLCVRGSLPDGRDLANKLAKEFGLDEGSGDLAEIAQRVAMTKGESRLYRALTALRISEAQPTALHRLLADFPGLLRRRGLSPCHQMIVTTGYDHALERAFEDVNEPFDLVVYVRQEKCFVHIPWDDLAVSPTATLITNPDEYYGLPLEEDLTLSRTTIVKLHYEADGAEGAVHWKDNFVVTEDHYIDYLPSRLPRQVLERVTSGQCMFLGYRLSDWYARVLLRRIWNGQSPTENSWAVEDDPDVMEKASWGAIARTDLFDSPLSEYADRLRATLEARLAAGGQE